MWVPDDNVLQVFRLDPDSALRPSDIICLAAILVNRISELLDIDAFPLFKFRCGPRLWGRLGLIKVALARKRGYLDIFSRSTNVVVEKSLELQRIVVGLVGDVEIRAKLPLRKGHDVFEEDGEDRLQLW